jgi:hypothetical protein
MGRPSPAGSRWHQAFPQKQKQTTRKPPVTARDFIGRLPRFPKRIESSSFSAASNLHAMESKDKLFHKLYNAHLIAGRCRLATHLTLGASTLRMNLERASFFDKPPASQQ